MVRVLVKSMLWSIIPIGMGILLVALAWNGVERLAQKRTHDEKAPSELVSRIRRLPLGLFSFKKDGVASVFQFDDILYPPQPKYFVDPKAKPLSIGAVSYVIGDVNTGEIILEKNSNSSFPIASVTKLMTALVSLETLNQEQTTKVSSRAANTLSSRGGFRAGEKVLISDLLYPLLLVSSNDAAEVLAEADGRASFINNMNTFAKKLGMQNTSFDDPSGLSANNTSTAHDLFTLSSYLENNHRVVFDISMLTEYTALGKVWNNINKFSNNDNFIGGKTGYTDRAKRTGVGLFSVSFPGYEDRHIGIVLLRTDDRTKDIYTILNYLREHVTYGYEESLSYEGEELISADTDTEDGLVAGATAIAKKNKKEEAPVQTSPINSCEQPETPTEDKKLENVTSLHPLPSGYVPPTLVPIKDLVDTKGRAICMTNEAADALHNLYEDASTDGVSLVVTSAFRSEQTQKWLYDDWHKQNTTAAEGEAIAKPGYSEHQLGTTIDFTAPLVGFESAHRGFYRTPEYIWLQNNAYKYGFVMSYPEGKDTGYIFEPWHWRYVGTEESYHLKIADITLQEFLTGVRNPVDTKRKNEVTLSFLGDIMMDRSVKTSVYKNYGGDWNALFRNLGELQDDDITFANLEGPVSDVGNNVGSKFSFRMEEKSLEALKRASFEVVSFANNHVGDWNVAAFNDTLANLDANHIAYAGAGKNKQDASTVEIIEKNGVRVGFLAFTDVGPNWMAATDTKSGILLASDPKRLEYIEEAKKLVDVLVVSYHWGDEYKEHNERQRLLAESSIDSGATIVVGHHPHVMQDTVAYKDGLIIYSLGNAIFDQYFSEETMKGGLVNVTLDKNGLKDYTEKYFVLDKTYVPGVPVLK